MYVSVLYVSGRVNPSVTHQFFLLFKVKCRMERVVTFVRIDFQVQLFPGNVMPMICQ